MVWLLAALAATAPRWAIRKPICTGRPGTLSPDRLFFNTACNLTALVLFYRQDRPFISTPRAVKITATGGACLCCFFDMAPTQGNTIPKIIFLRISQQSAHTTFFRDFQKISRFLFSTFLCQNPDPGGCQIISNLSKKIKLHTFHELSAFLTDHQ